MVRIEGQITSIKILVTFLFILIVTFCFLFFILSQNLSNLTTVHESQKVALNDYLDELGIISSEITTLSSSIDKRNSDLQIVQNKIHLLNSSNRKVLTDPLYWETRQFLNLDQTNRKRYDDETFNCAHFSAVTNNNAENKGIRCGFVVVKIPGDQDHACIAFQTTDHQDIVFFEPQTDRRVYLEIGRDYWADCMEVGVGYYYERDPNWVIEGWEIYW